jgi:toxin CcdB
MSQFDVYDNPLTRFRRMYPFVAVLQADHVDTGHDRIVAPLVPRAKLPGVKGRLTPIVKVGTADHVLLVQYLSGIPAVDLREVRGQLGKHRHDIVAALDYLFLGV